MSEEHIGRTCPYCQVVIKPGQNVVVCSQCGVAHHKECWDANGGCTTLSCAGGAASQAVARPMPPRMPAPPVTRTPQPAPRKSRKLGYFLGGMLVVMLLAIAFALGRATVGGLAAETDQFPAAGNVGAGLTNVAGQPKTPPKRFSGKYYLVIQGMQGAGETHRKEAERIVEYLQVKNVAAEVRTYHGPPQQYVVWSLDQFDLPSSKAAEDYVEFIEELGKQYKAKGGKYAFKQTNGNAWWLQAVGRDEHNPKQKVCEPDVVASLEDFMTAVATGDIEKMARYFTEPKENQEEEQREIQALVLKLSRDMANSSKAGPVREFARAALQAIHTQDYELLGGFYHGSPSYSYTVKWNVGLEYLPASYRTRPGACLVTEIYRRPGWKRWVFVKVYDDRYESHF